MSKISIDHEKCKRDGFCVAECPVGIIVRENTEAFPAMIETGEEYCINCGHCLSVCPHAALTLGKTSPADCAEVSKNLLPDENQVALFLKSRRSIRAFKNKPLDRELIEKIIDVARYAPTGHNDQPVQWLVVYDTAKVIRMSSLVADWMQMLVNAELPIAKTLNMDLVIEAWKKGADKILRGAPHLLIAHADRELAVSHGSCMIAVTYAELAAYSLGVGACWAGFFSAAAATYPPLVAEMALPKNNQIFGALMIGLPKYAYHRIPPRNKAEITWL